MTHAVLDPNVLIAGVLSPHGPPASVLRSWRSGGFDLIVSPMLLSEFTRAMGYPRIRERVSEAEATRLIESFSLAAVRLDDPTEQPRVSRDPHDDYLFALARASADVLVSGDKDVLEALDPGVRVITPAGFAEILRTRWN